MSMRRNDNKYNRLVTRLLGQPVYRLLLVGVIMIGLIPVGILGFRLYQVAWNDAWREINEKHRVLAMNLASPIRLYVKDRLAMLDMMAQEIETASRARLNVPASKRLMQSAFTRMMGFRAIALVAPAGQTRALIHQGSRLPQGDTRFANETCFVKTRNTETPAVSNAKFSPTDGAPTVILSQPVRSASGALVGVLIGELDIAPIEELRRNIHFGQHGHSAIVDKTGHVIAHPNPQWMKDIHDISDWAIVRDMMDGKTGVAEFYSTFTNKEMVAGYTSVPGLGWGVMVPQPKSEVSQQVYHLLRLELSWGMVGLALAVILVVALVRWITKPINRLAADAQRLTTSDFEGEPPVVSDLAPQEIRLLGTAMRNLVSGFQASRAHVHDMNRSLQSSVEESTRQLREANARLEQQVNSDYLTGLPNRRHFEHHLLTTLRDRDSHDEPLCIISIDIDNFKEINDRHGHAAGDMVLTDVAEILSNAVRSSNDLVARYGGDEFVAQLNCPATAAGERSNKIRREIEQHEFEWGEARINVTVSIGVLEVNDESGIDMESVLHDVDHAMYQAKRRGRNTVAKLAR
jgi:diguanylate cyclase (GGDEF)-like protein